MIKIEKVEIFNIEGAMRGMRNPMNSWKYNDTEGDQIGEKDLDLAKRLAAAGTDHRKYLRQIMLCVDLTGPLYWWKEFDTYKVGTTANSTSTMHKITSKKFELNDFSNEHMNEYALKVMIPLVNALECMREEYLETRDKRIWYSIIQLLPSSYNQLRTTTLNYEVLANIYHSRRSHKLEEWHTLCDWIESLPYAELITD